MAGSFAFESEPDWSVDPTKCVGCGDCATICPVSVFRVSPAPCQSACPIGIDVAGCVSLLKQGKFEEAWASIRQANPFARITGRVCPHPCEKECTRSESDGPVGIRALERFTADYGQDYRERQPSWPGIRHKKVAIAGSGPAGLMAAYDLARLGYKVTIFESLPVAGGMLYVGIPEYRLPKEIVKTAVSQIENLGVEIRLSTTIGKVLTIADLFEQDYGAILLATGAHKSLKLDIDGENRFEGVLDAITFLQEVNLGHKEKVTGKAIVVGGGNAAIDSARTLLRLGAGEVTVIYRRSRKEMPAIESEVLAAEQEGIKFLYLVAPTRVLGNNGKVVGLECVRMELGSLDSNGHRQATPAARSEFTMETNIIISAIGQKPDLSFLSQNDAVSVSEKELITVDTDMMATNKAGIFAAGDNVTGPASVVEALTAARKAALAIDKHLRDEDIRGGEKAATTVKEEKRRWWGILKGERQKVPQLSFRQRILNFNEVELSLTRTAAVEEARRCLLCAIFAHMDLESCCRESCRICERHCWQRAIKAY